MITRVAIDPNVRVRGDLTYSGFEDVDGPAMIGDFVQVYEQESGLVGIGRIVDVDAAKRLVYLAVDWAELRIAPDVPRAAQPSPARYYTSTHASGGAAADTTIVGGLRQQLVATANG